MSRNLGVLAILTVLAGASLYWIDSVGFTSGWTTSGPGWGFGIVGILGIIGFFSGDRMGHNIYLFAEKAVQMQNKPTSEQMDKIQAAQRQLRFLVPIGTLAVILALLCMATARYWRF